jgi:Domain of unknown function (DUF5615)
MRFLANENFPGAAVTAIEAAGHDIVWVRIAAPGTTDADVLAWAAREERILLTLDKDFGELARGSALPRSCGVVLFRTAMPRPSRSYSPKIAHCERSVRLLPGTRVAAIASKDGDAAAYDLILTGWRFSTKGSMRRQCRDGYGPAAQNRPASARKTARSGHAVGR